MYMAHVCFVRCSDWLGFCGNVCCVVGIVTDNGFSLRIVGCVCVGGVMNVVLSV